MSDNTFGNVIYSYTRADAIEDGVLIDVTTMAKDAGFKMPTVVTQSIWHDWIEPDAEAKSLGQDVNGRLWDLLFMAHTAIKRANRATDRIRFQVLFTKGNKQVTADFTIVCGPGDTAAPVLTIMQAGDD